MKGDNGSSYAATASATHSGESTAADVSANNVSKPTFLTSTSTTSTKSSGQCFRNCSASSSAQVFSSKQRCDTPHTPTSTVESDSRWEDRDEELSPKNLVIDLDHHSSDANHHHQSSSSSICQAPPVIHLPKASSSSLSVNGASPGITSSVTNTTLSSFRKNCSAIPATTSPPKRSFNSDKVKSEKLDSNSLVSGSGPTSATCLSTRAVRKMGSVSGAACETSAGEELRKSPRSSTSSGVLDMAGIRMKIKRKKMATRHSGAKHEVISIAATTDENENATTTEKEGGASPIPPPNCSNALPSSSSSESLFSETLSIASEAASNKQPRLVGCSSAPVGGFASISSTATALSSGGGPGPAARKVLNNNHHPNISSSNSSCCSSEAGGSVSSPVLSSTSNRVANSAATASNNVIPAPVALSSASAVLELTTSSVYELSGGGDVSKNNSDKLLLTATSGGGLRRCRTSSSMTAGDCSSSSPSKRQKTIASTRTEKRDAETWVRTIATTVDPENLGPCEPGTPVTLEGIVWNETNTGVLVVNVTWRGKTYVGSLLDCTKYDWAPPRFPNATDLEIAKLVRGRGGKKCHNKLKSSSLKVGDGVKNNGGNSNKSSGASSPDKLNHNNNNVNLLDSEESATNASNDSEKAALTETVLDEPMSPAYECRYCCKGFDHPSALKYHTNSAHRFLSPKAERRQPAGQNGGDEHSPLYTDAASTKIPEKVLHSVATSPIMIEPEPEEADADTAMEISTCSPAAAKTVEERLSTSSLLAQLEFMPASTSPSDHFAASLPGFSAGAGSKRSSFGISKASASAFDVTATTPVAAKGALSCVAVAENSAEERDTVVAGNAASLTLKNLSVEEAESLEKLFQVVTTPKPLTSSSMVNQNSDPKDVVPTTSDLAVDIPRLEPTRQLTKKLEAVSSSEHIDTDSSRECAAGNQAYSDISDAEDENNMDMDVPFLEKQASYKTLRTATRAHSDTKKQAVFGVEPGTSPCLNVIASSHLPTQTLSYVTQVEDKDQAPTQSITATVHTVEAQPNDSTKPTKSVNEKQQQSSSVVVKPAEVAVAPPETKKLAPIAALKVVTPTTPSSFASVQQLKDATISTTVATNVTPVVTVSHTKPTGIVHAQTATVKADHHMQRPPLSSHQVLDASSAYKTGMLPPGFSAPLAGNPFLPGSMMTPHPFAMPGYPLDPAHPLYPATAYFPMMLGPPDIRQPLKHLDMLQRQASQYYGQSAAPIVNATHKIHELVEHARNSSVVHAADLSSSEQVTTNTSVSKQPEANNSKEQRFPAQDAYGRLDQSVSPGPPIQRHLHTHHHTHTIDPYAHAAMIQAGVVPPPHLSSK